jgi:hypothetical protein
VLYEIIDEFCKPSNFGEVDMIGAGRPSRALFTICILLLAVFVTASRSDTLVMPRELVDFARANGCSPIDDFFERPGMINPPYVYGWISGAAEDSAVFWCKKAGKSDKPYNLMFTVRDTATRTLKVPAPKQLSGCPAIIEYWNGPAGLSVETRSKLELRQFHRVTDPRPQSGGPTEVVANARVIVNDNGDGLTELFYCFRGQWLINLMD